MITTSKAPRVIIMGCGRVGAQLAENFHTQGYDVRVVDSHESAFERLTTPELRQHATLGDGTDPQLLQHVGIEGAAIFIATTNGDNRNIMAAQIAKRRFNIERVICRIYDPVRHDTYKAMGIESICPTRMGAEEIATQLGLPTETIAARLPSAPPAQPSATPYFLIGGGGQVGYHLAKELLKDKYEVTLLEKDPRRKALLDRDLGASLVLGDGCEARTLERVGCIRATALIAVTGDDEDNLVMCQLASHRFHVTRTIARVNNVANIKLFQDLGIEVTISPTLSILGAIESELSLKRCVSILDLPRAGLHLVEITLQPNSPATGLRLRDLNIPRSSNVMLIKRGEEEIAPDADTVLSAEDRLFAVVTNDGQKALEREILGGIPTTSLT